MIHSTPSKAAARRRVPAGIMTAVALLIAGCGASHGGRASGATAVAAATVQIASFKFLPNPVVLKTGGKITWENADTAPHTATADDGSFNTDTLKTGQTKTETFSKPGTYTYYCIFHRFMVGKVVVK